MKAKPMERGRSRPPDADIIADADVTVRAPTLPGRARYIRDIIRDKREWEVPWDRSSGFKGWYTRGFLPHCDKPGTIQFITYRLADAMPAARRHEWAALLSIEDERTRILNIEAYADRGYGECWLRRPEIASVVEENWLHFKQSWYRLIAWVIMPNHVHLLIEIRHIPLPRILKSWKAYTASRANQSLRRSGAFWQAEFFDRYIRDENISARLFTISSGIRSRPALSIRPRHGPLAVPIPGGIGPIVVRGRAIVAPAQRRADGHRLLPMLSLMRT